MNDTTNAAIVAHDAGAANHIIAWLRTGLIDSKSARLCLEGPAKKLASNFFPDWQNHTLDEALDNASILISGTGWQTSLEHEARRLARAKKIKSIAVIDHWTNYQNRFIRNNDTVLPDEIWVVDDYAKTIALSLFPDSNVIIQPNDYMAFQLEAIKPFTGDSSKRRRVLFLMEPIREQWDSHTIPGEFQAFDFFMTNLKALDLSTVEVIIKPHPSDSKGKYQSLIDRYSSLTIQVDDASTLGELLGWAEIVAGCQTYAMIVALAAGKTVVSALPPLAPPCVLPHKEIIQLSKLVVDHEIL